MIHVVYGQTLDTYLSLLEAKINTGLVNSKLRWLFKFTNDLTKDIKYAYGNIASTNDRYVKQGVAHNLTEDIFASRINFKPYGYWKYEVYEVSWNGTATVTDDTAPSTETEVLPVSNGNGVVQGKVSYRK